MAYNTAGNLRQTRPAAAFRDARDDVMRNALAERQMAGAEQQQQFSQRNALIQQDRQAQQDQLEAQKRQQAGEIDKRLLAANYLTRLSQSRSEQEHNFLADRMAATPVLQELGISREQLTPDGVRQILPMLSAEAGMAPQQEAQPEEYTLGPGQSRFRGGERVASVAPTPPSAEQRPQLVDVTLPDGRVQKQWVYPGSGSGTAIGSPVDAGGPVKRKDVAALRKEFEGMEPVKNYRNVTMLFNRAKTAPNTRAGDISIIYALGKMFDPTSVVREGELILAQGAAPWLRKVASNANSQITGKGALNPETRKEILDALSGQVESMRLPYDQERQRFASYASDYGVEPYSVVGSDANDTFSGKPPAAQGGPVRVNTPEEAAALPSGTQFVTPDGRVKVRP